jgi:hypothetical protein
VRSPSTYEPVKGKTYTLFGKGGTTMAYYQTIKDLAREVIEKYGDPGFIIQEIQKFSPRKRLLNKIIAQEPIGSPVSFILSRISSPLNEYTLDVEGYLKSIPLLKLRSRGLRTTRLQYYLYMLEIELTNRLYKSQFKSANKKIALLPHCLHDLTIECKAAPDGFDYKCKHCSKVCYQNAVTTLLEKNGIEAYIWMGADLKKEIRQMIKSGITLGILGIACIPELVAGMRDCQKYNLPVVGLPLDANRCVRWFSEFHKNSVNLEMLEKLIT